MAVSNSPSPADPVREPQPAAARAPKGLGLVTSVVLLVMALVSVGSLGFAAGRLTSPEKSSATGSPACSNNVYGPRGNPVCLDQLGRTGAWVPGREGGRSGMYGHAGVVTGTVQAIDSSSLTIRLAGGRTVQIALSSDTAYRFAGSRKAASGADVKIGATVTVTLTGSRTLTAGQIVVGKPRQ